jgi:hypothetical protein
MGLNDTGPDMRCLHYRDVAGSLIFGNRTPGCAGANRQAAGAAATVADALTCEPAMKEPAVPVAPVRRIIAVSS